MAVLEEALFARASGYAGLTALIGAGNSSRFYPQLLPQNPVYPAVVYQIVDGVPSPAMGIDTGITRKRVQLTVYALSPKTTIDVAEQLRLCFERWRGTVAGIVIEDTYIDNAGLDLPYEDATKTFPRVVDLLLWHRE